MGCHREEMWKGTPEGLLEGREMKRAGADGVGGHGQVGSGLSLRGRPPPLCPHLGTCALTPLTQAPYTHLHTRSYPEPQPPPQVWSPLANGEPGVPREGSVWHYSGWPGMQARCLSADVLPPQWLPACLSWDGHPTSLPLLSQRPVPMSAGPRTHTQTRSTVEHAPTSVWGKHRHLGTGTGHCQPVGVR